MSFDDMLEIFLDFRAFSIMCVPRIVDEVVFVPGVTVKIGEGTVSRSIIDCFDVVIEEVHLSRSLIIHTRS